MSKTSLSVPVLTERHLVKNLLALLVALMAAVCLFPGSAFALQTRLFESSLGSAGHGDGQLNLAAHSGVAVDEATHDIYVADTGNHRVVQFDPSKPKGEQFVRAFGADVGGAGVNVCTSGCAEGTEGSSPGALTAPMFVAVDNSCEQQTPALTGLACEAFDPSNGDLYVADTADNVVSKFQADGTLVSSWAAGGQLAGTPGGPFGELAGVAVTTSGVLAVFEVEPHLLFKFTEAGNFTEEVETPRGSQAAGLAVDAPGHFFKVNGSPSVEKLEGSGAVVGQVSSSNSTTGLAVDPSNGELFVDTGPSIETYAFTPLGEVVGHGCFPDNNGGESVGCPPTATFGTEALGGSGLGAGLAVDGTTHAVYAADAGAMRVAEFAALLLPDATTEPATAIGAESVTLHATVSAAGGPEADCEFQYATEADYTTVAGIEGKQKGFEGAAHVPCSPTGPFTGSGSEAVTAEVDGLEHGTHYVFRVVAINTNGRNPGANVAFRTLGPALSGEAASAVTASTAQVTGIIDAGGESATYHFEYGPTAAYGTSAPATDAIAAAPIATGLRTFGSRTIENVDATQGAFAVGQEIVGEGLPPGTTVTAIPRPDTLEISQFPLAAFPTSTVTLTSPVAYVTQSLVNLTPGTAYHFRLVATAAGVKTNGPDETFTTYAHRSQPLPDGRVYEMVSPAVKIGEAIPPEPDEVLGGSHSCPSQECLPGINDDTMPMQPAPDGNAMAFEGEPFSAGLSATANQYVARRSPIGWQTESITPSLATKGSFQALSSDLSRGVILQHNTPLSPDAPVDAGGTAYSDLYLQEQEGAAAPRLRPLVVAPPPHRIATFEASNSFDILFGAANAGTPTSPALTHLVFAANDALTQAEPGIAPAAPNVPGQRCADRGVGDGPCDLYEWRAGQLHLVNVLPGNAAAASSAVLGSGRSLAGAPSNGIAAYQAQDVSHAVSADGSRIFWSDGTGQLFVRIDGKETKEIHDRGRF